MKSSKVSLELTPKKSTVKITFLLFSEFLLQLSRHIFLDQQSLLEMDKV